SLWRGLNSPVYHFVPALLSSPVVVKLARFSMGIAPMLVPSSKPDPLYDKPLLIVATSPSRTLSSPLLSSRIESSLARDIARRFDSILSSSAPSVAVIARCSSIGGRGNRNSPICFALRVGCAAPDLKLLT